MGITETHYLNRKFIQTSEARQLDKAGLLQKIFAKGASVNANAEFAIKGPSELAAQPHLAKSSTNCPL